jgi:hypothetical protein
MACHAGTRVKNATELKQAAPLATSGVFMIHPKGKNDPSERFLVYCDLQSDPNIGWHLVFTAFPRVTSPYNNDTVGTNNRIPNGQVPLPTDDSMRKFNDTDIKTILNNGIKQTRTQWFHNSVEFPGTVFGDGSLTGQSTLFNEFDIPNNWSSASASSGQTFRRRRATDATFSATITSAGGSCSGAVGGWSNWYEQSCVRSWFAGCEGGPAYNHKCAGNIQDRADKLIIWAA